MQQALAPQIGGSLLTTASGLEQYLQQIRNYPLLTLEQEHDYGLRYQQHGDIEAAQALVLSHLRFVVHIARSYQGYGLALADLIQEGNLGLMKAVKRFDPSRGVRLAAFAVYWIRAEIHEFIIKNWRMVKIATTKAQRKLFFKLRGQKKHLGWLNNAEVQAIAQDLKVEESEVRQMEKRLIFDEVAFDVDPDDEEHAQPAQYLSNSVDPAEALLADEVQSLQQQQLRQALRQLDARSKDILLRRWLCDEGEVATLQALAEEYGVSAERIRQIEKEAIDKLRKKMQAAVLPA
jgi:RNA polymerase sigma-32 factor